MEIRNISLLGTSHIARQSVRDIRESFERAAPDILALELDRRRYLGLISGRRERPRFRDVFRIGIKGFIFLRLGAWAEKKLGDYVGMKPGADMLEGIRLARKAGKTITFIDRDIEITLKRLSKGITWKEKWNFLADAAKSFFTGKREIYFDLRKVPDESVIFTMLEKVSSRYPNIYRILVEERNSYMAKKLYRLSSSYPDKKILALVGAGHRKELARLLEWRFGGGPDVSYSFSFGKTG